MQMFGKIAATVVLTGAIAAAAVTPSEARNGRIAAAAGIGLATGVIVGAAAANANNGYYYGPGYYNSGYAYSPGYYGYAEPTYGYAEPAYVDSYAYQPAPAYRYSNPYRGNNYGNPYGRDVGASGVN